MEIMIIDDGVNEDCFRIGRLKHNLEVLETLEIVQRSGYDSTRSSHGSICAGIIKKYAPECEIGSIKVMDPERYKGTNRQLLLALEWCIKADVRLINMSLGSVDFRDYEEIRVLIAKLLKNKCIIIAACHNGNYYSVPACLSGVICVVSDHSYHDNQYMVNQNYLEQADVYASGRHLLRDYNNQEILIYPANSYAAPLVTSMAYHLLQKHAYKKVCEVKEALWDTKGGNKEVLRGKFDNAILKAHDRCHVFQNGCQTNFVPIPSKKTGLGYSIRPDFIESAIVLNYSNHTASEDFFFQVLKWYEKPDLSRLTLDEEQHNLVILLGDEQLHNRKLNHEIYQFIKDYKECINGLLYGGVMPEELKKLCEEEVHCLVWDEDAYQRLLQERKASSKECDVPIICINGPEKSAIQAVSLLEKEFRSNDYYAVKASAIKGSYLYGVEYINSTITPQDIFRYWEERYDNNVILYADTIWGIKNSDMQIILKKDEDILEWNKEKIIISASLFLKNMKEVYRYIIKYFEENETGLTE